jgi:hypothetical protein
VKEASHERPHIILIYFYEIPRISKFIWTEKKLMLDRGWEVGSGFRVSFGGGAVVP